MVGLLISVQKFDQISMEDGISLFCQVLVKSVADPDRLTGFLEPGQNFQIWMKIDKISFFATFFWLRTLRTFFLDPPLQVLSV